MKTKHSGLTVYKPVNLGMGRTGWECYRSDCTAISTGLYHCHSGAVERACAEHSGTCHDNCWSA